MEQAHITFHKQEWTVESGRTLRETLLQIGINPDNVVPLRNRQVITNAAIIQTGDEIKLVNVVAGG